VAEGIVTLDEISKRQQEAQRRNVYSAGANNKVKGTKDLFT
jgi:hypothetical protein